jgi:hypothetical protein
MKQIPVLASACRNMVLQIRSLVFNSTISLLI